MQILNINWVDWLLFIFLIVYIYFNSKKGFIYGFFDMLGFVLSLILAIKFYPLVSNIFSKNFSLSHGFSNAIGFLSIAIILEPIFFLLTNFLDKYIDKRFINSRANILLGFVPAVISGLVLVGFLLTAVITLPTRPDIKQAIVESKIGGSITRQTLGLERYLSDIFGGAVQDTLNFMTVKPSGDETVNLNFKTSDFVSDPASESRMLSLVNQERTSRGLQALSPDVALRSVARKHCEDMFRRGYFSHYTPDGLSPFDRMQKAGIEYKAAGENLAYAPTVEIAHQGLMESPGHKANILSSNFGKAGIGVISAGIYGRMFCQEFTD